MFGWMKTVEGSAALDIVVWSARDWRGYFVAAAYNLVRMAHLVSCQEPRPFSPCALPGRSAPTTA